MKKENKIENVSKSSNDNYNSIFATRFRELITECSLTLPQVAESVGATRQSIGHWKDGKALPNIEILKKLSELFNVTSDYLLGLSDYKTSQAADIGAITGLSDENIKILSDLQYELVTTDTEDDNYLALEDRKEVLNKFIRSMIVNKTDSDSLLDVLTQLYQDVELQKFVFDLDNNSTDNPAWLLCRVMLKAQAVKDKRECYKLIFQSLLDEIIDFKGFEKGYKKMVLEATKGGL